MFRSFFWRRREIDIMRLLKVSWTFVLAAITFICVRIAINNPMLVEDKYSESFYPFFAGLISSLSRLFPFSLWDLFWLIAILSFSAGIVFVIRKRIKLSLFILRLAQVLSILYTYFYISWGFNYFRPDIEKRIGLDVMTVDEKLFRSTLDSVIVYTNRNYTEVKKEEYPEIDREVEESYYRNSSMLDIKYPCGSRRPKKMIFSNLVAKFGISGYFGPFFNEINLNRRILPMEYPFLLAHEKAHQFGLSSEADANLAAFVVCRNSDDPKLRYSGYLALLLYFLEDAQYFHDYRDYLRKLDEPVIKELQFRQQYYFGLQNEAMGKAQETVYDAYLKTNHIAHGIKNYNQVVELAISWLVKEPKLSR
jgi:hypothetical protein